MILRMNSNALKRVKESEFKLEKEIQTLVENNLEELLSLKFVATEFSIEKFRFDSVAYDEESKAFVIIEYKKGKNESLVDQGLSYLNTLLKRKADFVLLFNETFSANKGLKDFEWSQTKVIFISPKFTTFQLNAALFKNIPFSFYEIRKFESDLIEFNEVQFEKEDTVDFDLMNDEQDDVKKEIKVFTEDDHLNNGSDLTKELYLNLKDRIIALGNDVRIEYKQLYVAFKATRNFCDVTLKKGHLRVAINLQKGSLIDNNHFAKLMIKDDGTIIGHWGNGDYQCDVTDESQLDYLITLIRQSYNANK